MTHHTPMKLRAVRCIATGKVTKQSSNKTKRLLKLGGYVEVFADGSEAAAAPAPAHGRRPGLDWRPIGIGVSVFLVALAVMVLLA